MIDNIIGNKTLFRILRFLYLSPNRYFSFLEIEKYVGGGREGIKLALRKLSYYGMVYIENKGGKTYKLKLDNIIVQNLSMLLEYEKKFLQGIDPKKLSIVSNLENDCIKNINGLKGIKLFGSVAKGKSSEKSDIDIFVLVEKGENNTQNKLKLEEIKEKYEEKSKIQTILMDEEEFNKKKETDLVKEIIKTGISLCLG